MKDDELYSSPEHQDATMKQLLTHLKQLRQAVPINQQLKVELKQRLLQQMKQIEQNKGTSSKRKVRPRWSRFLPLGIGIAAILVAYPLFNNDFVSLHKPKMLSVEWAKEIDQVALSPHGDEIGVVSGNASLTIYNIEEKTRKRSISLPQTKGKYAFPTWSPRENQIALVEETTEWARLWLITFDQNGSQYASRLLWEDKGVQLTDLDWNPVRRQLIFTRKKEGKEEVWVVHANSFVAEKLLDGRNAAWSSDGNMISFEKDRQINIMDLQTKQRQLLKSGTNPSWISENQFTYVSEEGQLVEVVVDTQTRQVTSEQIVNADGMTLIQANWSADGKHLVLAPKDNQQEVLYVTQRDE